MEDEVATHRVTAHCGHEGGVLTEFGQVSCDRLVRFDLEGDAVPRGYIPETVPIQRIAGDDGVVFEIDDIDLGAIVGGNYTAQTGTGNVVAVKIGTRGKVASTASVIETRCVAGPVTKVDSVMLDIVIVSGGSSIQDEIPLAVPGILLGQDVGAARVGYRRIVGRDNDTVRCSICLACMVGHGQADVVAACRTIAMHRPQGIAKRRDPDVVVDQALGIGQQANAAGGMTCHRCLDLQALHAPFRGHEELHGAVLHP